MSDEERLERQRKSKREWQRKWTAANPEESRRRNRECSRRRRAKQRALLGQPEPPMRVQLTDDDRRLHNRDKQRKWRTDNLEESRRRNRECMSRARAKASAAFRAAEAAKRAEEKHREERYRHWLVRFDTVAQVERAEDAATRQVEAHKSVQRWRLRTEMRGVMQSIAARGLVRTQPGFVVAGRVLR